MDTQITLVELAGLMAKATSTSKRVCELFLRELFATASQALINGESVKIKGIGSFKHAKVKPHKSVNAATGTTVEVAGYSRLSFVPDKALAEAVNQSFAQFETVVLDAGVTEEALADIDKQYPSVFDAQPAAAEGVKAADEAKKEAPEPAVVENHPEPEPEPEPVPVPEPEVKPEPEVAPAVVEPVVEPVVAPVVEPVEHLQPDAGLPARKPMLVGIPIDGPSQPVPEPEKEEEQDTGRHFYRPEPRNMYTPTPEQIEEASRKPNRRWMIWAVAGLVVLGALAWMLLRGHNDIQAEQHAQEVVQADTIVDVDEEVTKEGLASASKPAEAQSKAEEPKPQETKQAAQAQPQEKPQVKEPAAQPQAKGGERTDVVTSQIVLTTLSEKYYGSPWFWVYIYEENVKRGIINDPNNIRPGTRVVIPPAEQYGIDRNDKAALKKAQIKSMEYLRGR